jgi:radical SAM superfamily enzyme YgiQ (UPF0313 family)
MPVELGPIRPPSEARSLLVRVTRNCPWNRCTFCPVYKGQRFSIRPVADVLADIRAFGALAEELRALSSSLGLDGAVTLPVLRAAGAWLDSAGLQVAHFLAAGGEHAFLQDANSLVMRPQELEQVLRELRATFPSLGRITSYARAHTVVRRSPDDLRCLREAGLDRLHVGLESGSDRVLELMRKGVDSARHIEAGRRARDAGFELSEYLMPGLGGRALSREHALDSARALNAIQPDYIRLRTTAVVPGSPLEELVEAGTIEVMSDEEVVAEIRLLLDNLEVESVLQSDHVLNLLPELEGKLPEDRDRLLAIIDRFQALEPRLQQAFIFGRRAGLLSALADMERPEMCERALLLMDEALERAGGDLTLLRSQLMARML